MAHRRISHSPTHSLSSIIFFVTGLIIVIFLIITSILYLKTRHSLWANRSRLNFVWGTKPTRLVSLIPGRQLLLIDFPDDSSIVAARGYGEYPLSSLWRLAEIEHQSDLVAVSLQQFLGVPISAWITSPACSLSSDSQLSALKSCLTHTLRPTARPSTSFSRLEHLVFYFQMRQINLAQIKYLDLGQLRSAKATTLPDGQARTSFNQELLDADLEQQFFDPKLVDEHLTAEVINTTDHPNLANQAARLISHLGIPVLSTSNTSPAIQTCILATSSELQTTATVNQLLNIFQCQLQLSDDTSAASDFQLLLGEDFWHSWQGSR